MAARSAASEVAKAEAQTANPLATQWWPSPWGPQDERGANNRMTPAKVLEAARLIKTGKVYQLGIFINENLYLEDLAADRAYEFAWSFNPLPLKGATGSPGNSVAIA